MTTTSPTPMAPANWYPDPSGGGNYRYWDGVGWTMHVSPQPLAGGRPPAWSDPTPYHPNVLSQGQKTGFSTAGIVCGALAFLFFPIILGPAGLILGAVAKSKGDPRGGTAMLVSGLGLVCGMILGFLMYSASTY